eukprot:365419-Chlamydomonas_euryale.AAC.3
MGSLSDLHGKTAKVWSKAGVGRRVHGVWSGAALAVVHAWRGGSSPPRQACEAWRGGQASPPPRAPDGASRAPHQPSHEPVRRKEARGAAMGCSPTPSFCWPYRWQQPLPPAVRFASLASPAGGTAAVRLCRGADRISGTATAFASCYLFPPPWLPRRRYCCSTTSSWCWRRRAPRPRVSARPRPPHGQPPWVGTAHCLTTTRGTCRAMQTRSMWRTGCRRWKAGGSWWVPCKRAAGRCVCVGGGARGRVRGAGFALVTIKVWAIKGLPVGDGASTSCSRRDP